MAYKKADIYESALEASLDPDVFFISDIVAATGIGKSTFYEFFPFESEELDTIKKNLNKNKAATKVEIRKKLRKGEKAAELIALYKLICTEEERKALSQSYQKHEGEIANPTQVNLTKEQLTQVIDSLKPNEE